MKAKEKIKKDKNDTKSTDQPIAIQTTIKKKAIRRRKGGCCMR